MVIVRGLQIPIYVLSDLQSERAVAFLYIYNMKYLLLSAVILLLRMNCISQGVYNATLERQKDSLNKVWGKAEDSVNKEWSKYVRKNGSSGLDEETFRWLFYINQNIYPPSFFGSHRPPPKGYIELNPVEVPIYVPKVSK